MSSDVDKPKPCPAHRIGLTVTVTELGGNGYRCTKGNCSLQSGHPGHCEPGIDSASTMGHPGGHYG